MSTDPPSIAEQATVLRPTTPDRSEEHWHRSVVIWNLDGTLTYRDTMLPFLRRVCGALRTSQAVGAVAGRWLVGDGHNSTRATLLHQVLAGRTTAEIDDIAREYAQDLFSFRLRTDCLHRWNWHRHNGHRLIIASGSPDLYVKHLSTLLGANAVICTETAAVRGRLTGRIAGGDCRGAERARRVLAYLTERPVGPVWAYGNLPADRDLLDLADVGIRVSPVRHLIAMTHS